MKIGPEIEMHIVPNKQAVLFVKVNDEVVWERYWVQPFDMLRLIEQVADLLAQLDKQFTFVTKPREVNSA